MFRDSCNTFVFHQVNEFSKVAWYRVAAGAPDAFHVISKMSLSQQAYYHLLDFFRLQTAPQPQRVACQWVRDNRDVWEKWLPPTFTEKPKLYLAGLFPMSGGFWPQPGLVEGRQH